jgi:hypothetical protein
MAAAGTIEQMPWSRLRPRQVEPPCVIAAIPPEDVHSFLRLLAANPLHPFPDAAVLRGRVLLLRNMRADTARDSLMYVPSFSPRFNPFTRLASAPSHRCIVSSLYTPLALRSASLSLSRKRRHHDTNDDGLAASKPMIGQPRLAPSADPGTGSSSAAASPSPPPHSLLSKTLLPSDDAELNSLSAEAGPAQKRARRSSRALAGRRQVPALPPTSRKATTLTKSIADAVKLGPEYQADVPSLSTTPLLPRDALPPVSSPLVYSPRNAPAVDTFLATVNNALFRRDGFPLSPVDEERALALYASYHGKQGQEDSARRDTLRAIHRPVVYPGAGPPWTNEEQCLLARTLCERHRDFEYISRHILPARSTKELVVHYYTRYKQLWQQFGGRKESMLFDRGLETPLRIAMCPEMQVECLHNLAVSAGDGFPPERRMRDAILAARTAKLKTVARQHAAHARVREEQRIAALVD